VPAQDLDTDPPGGADASPETRNPPPAEQAPAAPVALFELAPQPKPAARPDLADAVLAEMRAAVRLVTGKPGGPRDTPGNRKLIRTTTKREGATLEDWQHVIAAQVASVRRDPSAWRWLCLSTITGARTWARLLDAPAPRESARGPVDPSTQNHLRDPIF